MILESIQNWNREKETNLDNKWGRKDGGRGEGVRGTCEIGRRWKGEEYGEQTGEKAQTGAEGNRWMKQGRGRD